ncbi:MAG: hypothetical protein Q8S57_10160 [Methanoregula sp.]|nr:hypothetical protein [Methanoregula sp.]
MADDKTCCASEALRRIRQIPINGIMTGITMPDESITDVKEQNLGNDSAIQRGADKEDPGIQLCSPGRCGSIHPFDHGRTPQKHRK